MLEERGMSEYDQLEESLLFGSDAEHTTIDAASLVKLQEEYEAFCSACPHWIDVEEQCFVYGDPYEQFAHDYVMTRMRHGVGFWEKSDWESYAGDALTKLCHEQGDLETYIGDDNKLYIL